MKRLLLAVVCCVIVGSLSAADAPKKRKAPRGAWRDGGPIEVPNSQKGKIAIVNAQKKVPLADYRAPLDEFAKEYKYNVQFAECSEVSPKTASDEMKKAGAQIAVFLTECKECPLTMLVAPDAKWAIVNVEALTKDAKNEIFAAARTRKALMRAFLCAAGAMDSQYPGSMMSSIKEPADLDKIVEDPPVDAIMRAFNSMKVAGVTPTEITSYRVACQQGWAPKPTTDYQQKMWDQVHAIPTKPITIEKK